MKSDIWLDCDPGHDDFCAILMASMTGRLVGISTSAGNQTLKNTTFNTFRSLAVAGKLGQIPVYAGRESPLVRNLTICPEIHGSSGLDGIDWSQCGIDALVQPHFEKAWENLQKKGPSLVTDALKEAILKANEKGTKLDIIITGSQTNIASFALQHPQLMTEKYISITFMGGAIGLGNTQPHAEFNIEVDPEAASIIAQYGFKLPVTMVPLEVTHSALMKEETNDKIKQIQSQKCDKFGHNISTLMNFFKTTYNEVFFMPDPPVHDPCAVLYVLEPELFTVKRYHVDIETKGEFTFGTTCVDYYGFKYGRKEEVLNMNVCTAMDVPAFWDRMVEVIQKCSEITHMQ